MKELDVEIEQNISERFKFLWEQYIKIINLTISLSVGTLLVFANNIFSKDNLLLINKINYSQNIFAFLSIIFIFIGLIFAILWRILSQHYMEKEVFGNKKVIIEYLQKSNIYDFKYNFEKKKSKFKRKIWRISQYICFLMLFLGLVSFLIFFFKILI